MNEVINFPLDVTKQLSFAEASAHVGRESPQFGLIAGYDESNRIFIINFGDISRENALWLAHQLIRHSQGDLIS